ncbi:MAG: ankyrin repeat domain-containing protein [Phycisphaerae bacterium]|nr:ankyrin repeat domain-containing protein [Phycisphaerae bacterium]
MKRTALLTLLLLVAIAGCGRMPGYNPELSNLPPEGTTVPMRIAANSPLVEVYLNSKGPYTFLLDTGCTYVLVSQRVSDELGLKEWQTDRVSYQTYARKFRGQTTWARLGSLKLGELELKQLDVGVQSDDRVGYDGILGIDFLRQWVLTIDFPAKQVMIAQGQLSAPDNQTSFSYKTGTPKIPVTIGDHKKLMIVDTGSTGAFSVAKGWEKQLHFAGNPYRSVHSGFITSAEALTGRVSDKISFGEYSFTEPTVDVGGIGFLVGVAVLKNFRITLDQKKKIICFESSKHFPLKLPPHEWLRVKNLPSCVKDWISEGQDVDATDQAGYTALFAGAYQGHADAVTKLTEAGGNVNFTAPDGATPLLAAANAGHKDMLKLLLNNGADISAKTNGQDALFISATYGHAGCVSLLISKGAKVETQDEQGITALMAAAWKGHEKVVRVLLNAGADPNHLDNKKQSVLTAAAAKGHLQIAQMLVDKDADVNLPVNENYTPLMSAARDGHIEVVKLLLDKGADPSTKDADEKTALDYAKEKKHEAVAQLLAKIAGS